jgi:hypothetical protein
VSNVDEMHTYDGSDLLSLNGVVARDDGVKLVICKPYILKLDLFDERRDLKSEAAPTDNAKAEVPPSASENKVSENETNTKAISADEKPQPEA